MEERIIRNDETGEEIAEGDYIIVRIERPGYNARYANGNITNALILHLKHDVIEVEGTEWVKNLTTTGP